MASPRTVFLLGAGYIGHNILDQLLAAGYPVTVLVRQPSQASSFEKSGAKTILGSLSNLELLTAQTAQHEITINTANSDDLPGIQALLEGVRQRVQAGLSSIFIHTSGTGALEDGAVGMYKNEKIYRDDIPGEMDNISPLSFHQHVDIPIRQAAREFGDKAKVAIILPPFVYGWNAAHNRHSFALKAFVRFALKHGFAGFVGEGANIWSVVHIADLGCAYMTLLEYMEKSAGSIFSENPYFFVENGSEVTMLEVAETVGRTLYDMRKIPTPEVKAFTESDYMDVAGPMTPRGLGCNSRSRAIRLKELGWESREKSVWTSWNEDDIPSLVKDLEKTLDQ
jgi:nucleoside-diphosphate-sugar epimerase